MSRWAGTCTLVGEDVERDEFGVARAKPRKRPVACNVYGISAASYYAAAQAGVRPRAVLEVRACAYLGEALVEFGGTTYAVDSAVMTGADDIRLTLVERVGDR